MSTFLSRQFWRTLVRRLLAFFGICVLFFIVAQSTILPGVVERMVQRAMEASGFPVQSLELRSVSWSHAVFSSLVLGTRQELKMDTLQVEYNLPGLLRGEADSMHVSGALITLPWQMETGRRAAARLVPRMNPGALPIRKLTLASSSLLFTSGEARFRIPFEATLQALPTRYSVALELELLGGQTTLSAGTSAEGELQRVQVNMRGVNPSMLPLAFLPPVFSAPLQGAVHGTLQAARKNGSWEGSADLNFHLAGVYEKVPFLFQPARVECSAQCNQARRPERIQAEIACEHLQIAGWSLNNLSISTTGDGQALSMRLTGAGDAWDFSHADARVTDYIGLLKALMVSESAVKQPPHVNLTLHEFNRRTSATRAYIQEAVFDADLTCRAALPRFLNPQLTINNGQLTAKNLLVHGIHATLHMEELFPPITRGVQEITAERAVFGRIELTDGQAAYQMENTTTLHMERCEWTWCGGRISTRAFSIPLDAPEIKCAAFFENISLEQLTTLLLPGKLQGSAHLFGRMPVNLRLAPELGLSFGKGYLYAVPSFGTLRVMDETVIAETLVGPEKGTKAPPDKPHGELVREALQDYRFQLLKINFDRLRENGLSGHIQLRGNGPPPHELVLGLNIPFALD